MKKFERVTEKRSLNIEMADHEVLLSFYDDSGAEAFDIWWEEEGKASFRKWMENREEFKDWVE